jgi:hypothetical protein
MLRDKFREVRVMVSEDIIYHAYWLLSSWDYYYYFGTDRSSNFCN